MARAPVSKTGGWGFESLHSCQAPLSRRHLLRLSAALPAQGLALPVAQQEAYAQVPKSIRFIVPFPAGGGRRAAHKVAHQRPFGPPRKR